MAARARGQGQHTVVRSSRFSALLSYKPLTLKSYVSPVMTNRCISTFTSSIQLNFKTCSLIFFFFDKLFDRRQYDAGPWKQSEAVVHHGYVEPKQEE